MGRLAQTLGIPNSPPPPAMPTKPIDRLLFIQGKACFFCKQEIPKGEATVEHLVAVTHGGKDSDENCVACCANLNRLLGRMSLKEKFQICLIQKGEFICPGKLPTLVPATTAIATPEPTELKLVTNDPFDLVVIDLQKRGNSRPSKPDRLLNTIRSTLISQGKDKTLAEGIQSKLVKVGFVSILETKVSYALPKRAA